jgi:hypothetical protein
MSNAKQVVIACRVYAMDHNGKFPPTLDALVPDYLSTSKVFVSPLFPLVPMGYKYTAGLRDTSPPILILIEDKFAPKLENVRIVVYTNDRGEVLKLP